MSAIRLIDWAFEILIIHVYNVWCRNKHICELNSQNVINLFYHHWFMHVITAQHKTLPLLLGEHSLIWITTAPCLPVVIAVTTRTRWRRVKTLGQHQVGVNLQSHAQHQLWISTWHIFHEFHKIMPSLSYPASLVNQNVILVNISHWWLHMALIMSLMST